MKMFLTLVVAVFVLSSCRHQPGNLALPVKDTTVKAAICDTMNVIYVADIKPVFIANCYSCHGTAVTDNGGLNLEDTASLRQYLQQGFRGDGIYGSKLYHCLIHSLSALPMPPTYIVDSCSLMKVKRWLNLRAPM
jgi:hypothetical protein